MLFALACIAGLALGLTFNVLVLLPLTLVSIFAAFSMMEPGTVAGWGIASNLVPTLALQAGYMLGLTVREPVAELWAKLDLIQSKRA